MSDDGLPTYEVAVQSVATYVSTFAQTAQAEKVLLQAHVESAGDVNINTNQNPLDFSFLSKEENEKLTLEVAKLVSSEQGKAIMRAVAQRINKDIKSIRNMFFTTSRRLQEIDNSGKSKVRFNPKLEILQKEFNNAIDESRELAQSIAAYAEDFEDLILPLYNDNSISLDDKKAMIKDYIEQAEKHSSESAAQKEKFQKLLTNFNNFVGDFKEFAKDEQTSIEADIKKAEGELLVLQDRVATALGNAQKSFFIGAGTGLLGGCLLGLLCPPLLPVMLVGGAVVAGVGAAVAIGFKAHADSLQKEVDKKQAEVKAMQDKLGDLKKVRQELVQMGEEDFKLIQKSLDSIIMVWDSAKRDAHEIMEALEKGLKLAHLQPGLRIQLNKSVSAYKSVAVYLRGYANGSTGE